MSLKKIVIKTLNLYDGHSITIEALAENISVDLVEYLRPELERLIVSMVPMEHLDSFLDERINHLLGE